VNKKDKVCKNSVDSYPLREKIVLVMKDNSWVEQAVGMRAILKAVNQKLLSH